ncbi:MAG TPA: type II toxin-antitoxin system VapC family toxin [Terriglobia bacterium]|nr:type II toxin-antitoxin system VapC family toxin [Terriglobia bacterium]
MRVFLDTNVFLYAAGAPHPQKEACANLLRRVANGTLVATVNTEVLQEILYVLTRHGRREDALKLAGHLASLFPDLLSVTREDMLVARDLLRRYPRLSVRDSVHVATMLRNGLKTVVSVDRDFDRVPEVRRRSPASI